VQKTYWLGRKRSVMAMAKGATSSEARLIHLHLAGVYSVKAASIQVALALPIPQPALRT
jgi:hypothetical protein